MPEMTSYEFYIKYWRIDGDIKPDLRAKEYEYFHDLMKMYDHAEKNGLGIRLFKLSGANTVLGFHKPIAK